MARLKKYLKPAKLERLEVRGYRRTVRKGSTIMTVLRNVSPSGMTRRVSAFTIVHGEVVDISRDVAIVLTEPYNYKEGSIKVTGCGMDMGFDLVHRLGYALWGKKKDGSFNRDSGYMLAHRWL